MVIVGGTVTELGGGKFANGAWSTAFQYLLNDMYYGMSDPLTGDSSGILDSFYESVQDGWDSLHTGATNFTAGLVSGLKSANSYSTYMGLAWSTVATSNALALPVAVFWDVSAAGTELLLIGLGNQNINASLANSANGAIIDNMTPSGRAGALTNAALKTMTQAK